MVTGGPSKVDCWVVPSDVIAWAAGTQSAGGADTGRPDRSSNFMGSPSPCASIREPCNICFHLGLPRY